MMKIYGKNKIVITIIFYENYYKNYIFKNVCLKIKFRFENDLYEIKIFTLKMLLLIIKCVNLI